VQGLGIIDVERIAIEGEPLEEVITEFELPSAFQLTNNSKGEKANKDT